jgi:glycogen synthase
MWAINEALAVYGTEDWPVLLRNAMTDDFSWNYSAGEYIELYKKIINEDY